MLISNPVDIGAVVRQRRIDLNMSQTELAERIATTRQWMSRFE
jgi:transcriptional regulator with XRE-family HTH domain